jgi:hypothetical protein
VGYPVRQIRYRKKKRERQANLQLLATEHIFFPDYFAKVARGQALLLEAPGASKMATPSADEQTTAKYEGSLEHVVNTVSAYNLTSGSDVKIHAPHALHTIMDERVARQDHHYRRISVGVHITLLHNYNVVGIASDGCREVVRGPWPVTCLFFFKP